MPDVVQKSLRDCMASSQLFCVDGMATGKSQHKQHLSYKCAHECKAYTKQALIVTVCHIQCKGPLAFCIMIHVVTIMSFA